MIVSKKETAIARARDRDQLLEKLLGVGGLDNLPPRELVNLIRDYLLGDFVFGTQDAADGWRADALRRIQLFVDDYLKRQPKDKLQAFLRTKREVVPQI